MKVRLMIIIGVISFLLGGCNKIQKNSNQVQLAWIIHGVAVKVAESHIVTIF